MMKPLLIALLLFSGYHFSVAQVAQPKRYEIELESFDDSFFVVSAKENGLVIFRENTDVKEVDDKKAWDIQVLDTGLNVKGTKILYIEDRYSFAGYDFNDGRFVMLFKEGGELVEEILFVNFFLETMEATFYQYDNIVPIELTDFEIKGEAAIFGGNVNTRTVIMMYNFRVERGIVLPGFYNDRSKLLQIVTSTGNDNVQILTSEKRMNNTYGVTIRSYNLFGEQQFTFDLDAKDKYSLSEGRITGENDGNTILAGTYSYKRRTETSRGLYISNLAVEQPQVDYYNYADLENFFNYMRENRQKRIERRIKRKKVKGKKLKFSYRLNVQDVIEQENQNILIGEAYYPTYATQTYGFGVYSRAYDPYYNNTVRDFDGYKYTHAVVIAFDDNGNLLWDNSFEINDLKSFTLKSHIKVARGKDGLVMLYLYDQKLRVKIIEGNEIVEGKFTDPLKTKYQNDQVLYNEEELEGLEKWYGSTFYAYGVNRVKNLKDVNVKLNRKVFFINKIVVQ